MNAVELEQDVDRVAFPIVGVVALVGFGAGEAALFRLVSDALCGLNEIARELSGDAPGLEPGELDRERVQVGAERGASEGARLDHDGAAATKGIEHAGVTAGETFDEPARGLRVEAGRVAMEPVHVLHHLVFVGADVEGVSQGGLLLFAASLDRHLAADVTERTALASRLRGRFVLFSCSFAGASDGTRGGRLRGGQGSSISAGGGLFLAGPEGPLA